VVSNGLLLMMMWSLCLMMKLRMLNWLSFVK